MWCLSFGSCFRFASRLGICRYRARAALCCDYGSTGIVCKHYFWRLLPLRHKPFKNRTVMRGCSRSRTMLLNQPICRKLLSGLFNLPRSTGNQRTATRPPSPSARPRIADMSRCWRLGLSRPLAQLVAFLPCGFCARFWSVDGLVSSGLKKIFAGLRQVDGFGGLRFVRHNFP